MKAVIQRVKEACVTCGGKTAGRSDVGLLVLLGVDREDTYAQAKTMAEKIANIRIFDDENGKLNLSVLDIAGSVLAVSNFTLCADVSHGRRPSFAAAAAPEWALELYDAFCDELLQCGVKKVEKGVFGGDMQVSLVNDGPVTLFLDTAFWK